MVNIHELEKALRLDNKLRSADHARENDGIDDYDESDVVLTGHEIIFLADLIRIHYNLEE